MAERIGYYSPERARLIDDVVQQLLRTGLVTLQHGPGMPRQRYDCWIIKTDSSGCSARSGTTMGTGTGAPYVIDDSDLLVEVLDRDGNSIAIDLYNLASATVAGDTYIQCKVVSGRAVVDWEECV